MTAVVAPDGAPSSEPEAPQAASPRGRDLQKAATRNRVIEAARELFETRGYEDATIREIARKAGVSVGSVFTTFASKGDVLSEVMQQRLEGLYAELNRVAPGLRGSTVDRLRAMFAVHFAFEAPRTRLFLAHVAAVYDWTLPPTAKPYGRTQGLQDIMRACLEQGLGEDVDPAADLDAVLQLLMAAYAWTYRLAAQEGLDADALTAVMDKQIDQIARGFEPRSA